MFSPVKNTKVYEQVVEQIKDMVIDGTLRKGDKLPSERDLSVQLSVSRASVREALRSLEIIGLVQSRQGEGNFICSNLENVLLEPLSLIFLLNRCETRQILELREVMEIETAVLAVEKASNKDIAGLEEIVYKIIKSNDEIQRTKYDKEFHYYIASMSKNILIISVLNTVSCLMDKFIENARYNILNKVENKDIINLQHINILDAIKNRDSGKVRIVMKEHMDLINKYLEETEKLS